MEHRNAILRALPADELAKIVPHLVRMPHISRQTLYEPNHPVTDLYLVETGMISLVIDIINDETVAAEVGVVGYEGLVGSQAMLFSNPIISYRALSQVPGEMYRLNAETARGLSEECPNFRAICFVYIDKLMKQTVQIAGCNLRHTVNERLSRWLLMTRDRIQDDVLPLTQDFLAAMLGVRRAGVSLSTSTLQKAGLVQQARGRIIIVDPDGLERAACGCYRIVRELHEVLAHEGMEEEQ